MSAATEKHYSVIEVAEAWGIGANTVRHKRDNPFPLVSPEVY